eukprot:g4949.t1
MRNFKEIKQEILDESAAWENFAKSAGWRPSLKSWSKKKKDRELFKALNRGYVNSGPARLARAAGPPYRTSIDDLKFQIHLLNEAYGPKEEVVRPPTPMPWALEELFRLQQANGQWLDSPEFWRALGGRKLKCPEDFRLPRWTTALGCAFLRRHPLRWERLRKAYDKAYLHVDSEVLMKIATRALPPGDADKPCTYPLDDDLVYDHNWKEAQMKLLRRKGGYTDFYDEKMAYDAPTGSLETIIKERKHKEEIKKLESQTSHQLVTGIKRFDWQQEALEFEYARAIKRRPKRFLVGQKVQSRFRSPAQYTPALVGSQWHPAEVVRVNVDGQTLGLQFEDGPQEREMRVPKIHVRHYVKLINKLSILTKRWEKPLASRKERRRVQQYVEPPEKAPWLGPLDMRAKEGRKKEEKKGKKKGKTKRKRKRRKQVKGSNDKQKEEQQKWSPAAVAIAENYINTDFDLMKEKKLKRVENEYEPGDSDAEALLLEEEEKVQKLEQEALGYILQHDNGVKHLARLVKKASFIYRTAKLKTEKQTAFKETTKFLCALRELTLNAVEGIVKWRKALVRTAWIRGGFDDEKHARFVAPAICKEAERTPFIWEGENWILSLRNRLDFLKKNDELFDWYTAKFNWLRNPYTMPSLPEERPVTPRKGTIFLVIYGERVEKAHPTEMKERLRELALLNEWKERCAAVPAWWPFVPKDHQKRVRAAEKVILDEERWEKEKVEWIKLVAAGKDVNEVDKHKQKKVLTIDDDEDKEVDEK